MATDSLMKTGKNTDSLMFSGKIHRFFAYFRLALEFVYVKSVICKHLRYANVAHVFYVFCKLKKPHLK